VSSRLWVTGLGLVTPLGSGVEATWNRLVRGERAIRPVTLFDTTGQRVAIAGEVDGVPLPTGSREVTAAWSRTSAMAMVAAKEAMGMARLDPRQARVGLVVGGTTGGMFETEQLLARLHAQVVRGEALVEMLAHPLSVTGDRLDETLGPFVRVRTLSSACSSGANAMVVAAAWLRANEVDAVVAGGSDGLCRLTLSGFNALCALDPEPCRPFDRRRHGTSLGEGAGFLVLERADGALARGAAPVAELAGWALGSEAHHITNPAPDGAMVASLIDEAIARAGLSPREIDYVNAHGTGTPLNDRMEAGALARALGDELARIPVSSSKGQIGHSLGAAGAIEAAITALVVARRTLVPTAGLDEPDGELALVHVPHVGREVDRMRAAVSNAFGFGGMDTVLVFKDPGLASLERGAPKGSPRRPLGSTHTTAAITGVAVFGPCGRLATAECAALPEQRFALSAPVDPDVHLDPMRARRLDRAARLGAVVVEHALRDSGAPASGTGVLLGVGFGNVDGSAAFMHRIFVKGARSASPAEFPNLVPSSAVGHVSIYAGFHGPVFATADLGASGESAFAQASQLVAAGEAACIVAGAAEPKSEIVERALSDVFARAPSEAGAVRTDVAAAVVVEAEDEARGRAGRVLARVEQVLEWRGHPGPALASLRAPCHERSEVVVGRASGAAEELIAQTAWRACPRVACMSALGESDALGAVALAVAAARVGTGRVAEALVFSLSKGHGYAFVLTRA
jgi:3-oxoacyl-[acyl-carrier-protein] synthase II